MTLCFLLPTNDLDSFYEHIYPTFDSLLPLRKEICFAVNFQYPWDDGKEREVVTELRKKGFNVVYCHGSYTVGKRGYIPFNRIRYDCATLVPNADIYALCDDDFEFLPDAHLMVREIVSRFRRNHRLGVVQCRDIKGVGKTYLKVNGREHAYYTDSGFFFRNVYAGGDETLVYPRDALDLLGACEEFVIGLDLTEKGYTTELRTKSRISHCREYDDKGCGHNGWGSNEILSSPLGVFTYIEEKYGVVLKEVSKDECDRVS